MAGVLVLLILAISIHTISATTHSYDVVVYDASSAGVIAAVAASRHMQIHGKGKEKVRVALLCASWPSCWEEGGRRVGGVCFSIGVVG